MQLTTIGVDLAKKVLRAHGANDKGIAHIITREPEIIEDGANELPGSFRLLIQRLLDHFKELALELNRWHRENDDSRRLADISGVEPMTAWLADCAPTAFHRWEIDVVGNQQPR